MGGGQTGKSTLPVGDHHSGTGKRRAGAGATRTPAQGSALRAWLIGVRASFAGRILPFTDSTAILCAAMQIPNPRSDRDSMIAATALEHGMTVVTRNVVDFTGSGVQLINPFIA